MARYDGALGRTRIERVHYTCPCGTVVVAQVHRTVDAGTDPELAQRMLSTDPGAGLNTARCPNHDRPLAVDLTVVYHDPDNQLFVLVVPASMRHRGLRERAELMAAIADDTSAAVPDYVLELPVVYGGAGLCAHLERAAERTADDRRAADEQHERARADEQARARASAQADREAALDRLAADLSRRGRAADAAEAALRDRESALGDRESALRDRETALRDRETALGDREAALDARASELARVAESVEAAPRPAPAPAPVEVDAVPTTPHRGTNGGATAPFEMVSPASFTGTTGTVETHSENTESLEGLEPMPMEEGEVIVADQIVGERSPASNQSHGAPGYSSDGSTVVGGATDVAIEKWIVSRDKSLKLVDDSGRVRLAVCAEAGELEHLLGDRLGMKLQLHRLPSYPLATLTFGTPEMVRGDTERGQPLVFFFDIGDTADRRALETLGRSFTFRFELYDTDYLAVRKRTVSAELAENVGFLLSAADAHLESIDAGSRSFDRAIIGYDDPGYDRLGASHPERREFREDKLARLGKVSEVRRALAIARRFSLPEREAYLVLTRGYPLSSWREQRMAVLNRAIALGLWIGGTLSQVAVSEDLARSRKDLVARLRSNFARTLADGLCDLDEEAIADNWNSLQAEAEQLGLTSGDGPVSSSEQSPFASGTIGSDSGLGSLITASPASRRSVDQLIAQLDDDVHRLEAAVELARRGEERAIGPVFNSLRRMTRGEAVRVLGFAVGFGPAATPHLVDGLRSRKSFLRQGCALSLAVIGSETGIEAVCDQLVAEPTEIWQEIARAIGQVGPGAVMSLAARLAGQGERGRERVAWALAHIAAAGAEQPVRALAGGRDPVAAAVARQALSLAGQAEIETAEVLGARVPEEQTVNRAFSRSFFEAAQSVRPGAAPALVRDPADLSGPAMLLDESDLLEELDDAELLDESDLIPT